MIWLMVSYHIVPTASTPKKDGMQQSAEGPTVTVRRPKGKMYALPTPSVHHRHRAVPLYSREGRTERLTVRPSLFEPASLTLTSSFTERPIVSERVNKAWGFNVGCGPLWDLAEDRGWYKEAITTGNNAILRRSVGHGFILICLGGRSCI